MFLVIPTGTDAPIYHWPYATVGLIVVNIALLFLVPPESSTPLLDENEEAVEDVQALREYGWTDPQIAEAVYITAMFAFFNRVADAFGIPPQQYLELNAMTK